MHGLGLLDDQRGSAGQHDLPTEGLLDLLVHPEVVEDVELAFVVLYDAHLIRSDLAQELTDLLGKQLVIHMDVGEILVQEIAQYGTGPVDLSQHPFRCDRAFAGCGTARPNAAART